MNKLKEIEKQLELRKSERRNNAQKDLGLLIVFLGFGISAYFMAALSDIIGGLIGLVIALFGLVLFTDHYAYKTRLELIKKGVIEGDFQHLDLEGD